MLIFLPLIISLLNVGTETITCTELCKMSLSSTLVCSVLFIIQGGMVCRQDGDDVWACTHDAAHILDAFSSVLGFAGTNKNVLTSMGCKSTSKSSGEQVSEHCKPERLLYFTTLFRCSELLMERDSPARHDRG